MLSIRNIHNYFVIVTIIHLSHRKKNENLIN